MRHSLIYLFLLMLISSCLVNDGVSPETVESCVVEEAITSAEEGFLTFLGGPNAIPGQLFKGVRINEEWLSFGRMSVRDSTFRVRGWALGGPNPDFPNEPSGFGEQLDVDDFPIAADYSEGKCFRLSNEQDGALVLKATYTIFNGDLRVDGLSYLVDDTQDNYIEITEFDADQGILKGKMSVSFIDETPFFLPAFPTHIRFFNVSIDIDPS